MSHQVQCPHCKSNCWIARESVGRPLRCPRCKQTFAVCLTGVPFVESAPTPPTLIEIHAGTATGCVRDRNEDCYLIQHMNWGVQDRRRDAALIVVADGMGGHAGGDVAAALAIGTIAKTLATQLARFSAGEDEDLTRENLLDQVDHAFFEAGRAIKRVAGENKTLDGMGATAAAVLIRDAWAHICHVGDCRIYHARGGRWQRLTDDHTVARRLVEMGALSAAEAARHDAANQITQALGQQLDLEPSRRAQQLAAGDWLLVCCDGLHGQVSEELLTEELARTQGPRHLVERLLQRAAEAGGHDNCTVAVVKCD